MLVTRLCSLSMRRLPRCGRTYWSLYRPKILLHLLDATDHSATAIPVVLGLYPARCGSLQAQQALATFVLLRRNEIMQIVCELERKLQYQPPFMTRSHTLEGDNKQDMLVVQTRYLDVSDAALTFVRIHQVKSGETHRAKPYPVAC
jgi:hypothetical protein